MHYLLKKSLILLLIAGVVTITGCAEEVQDGVEDAEVDTTFADTEQTDQTDGATAQLTNAEGQSVGTLNFTSADGGVRVEGSARSLTPGEHGFHIHANGECDPDAADGPFTTAGDHWDPANTQNHGGPDDPVEERHMGDLGNIEAGQDSTAQIDETFDFLTLEGDTSVVDHAIMIHSDRDDLESNPSGNSGDRVVCGVIERGGTMGGMQPGVQGDMQQDAGQEMDEM